MTDSKPEADLPLLDYEEAVAAYRESLQVSLRGFRPEPEFLSSWVPDDDAGRSLFNLFEAAEQGGVRAVSVRLGATTLRALALDQLSSSLKELGALEIDDGESGLLLTLRFGGGAQRRTSSPARAAEIVPTLAAVTRVVPAAAEPGTAQAVDGDRLVEAYVRRVSEAAAQPRHEGPLSAGPGIVLEGSLDGAMLRLRFFGEQWTVLAAVHGGATRPSQRAVLDTICDVAIGLPARELFDHGALLVESSLRDPGLSPPVPGIVTPENAGPLFAKLTHTLRDLERTFVLRTTNDASITSSYDGSPQAAWTELSEQQRLARIAGGISSWLAEEAIAADGVRLQRLERRTRVVVCCSDQVAPALRPRVLFRLERALREGVEPSLRLYAEPMRDLNRIRRLP